MSTRGRSTRGRRVQRQFKRGLLKSALILVYALLGLFAGGVLGRVMLAEGQMGFDAIAASLSGALVGGLLGVITGGIFAFSRRGEEAVRRSRRALIAGVAALVIFVIGVRLFVGDRSDAEAPRPSSEQPAAPDRPVTQPVDR